MVYSLSPEEGTNQAIPGEFSLKSTQMYEN